MPGIDQTVMTARETGSEQNDAMICFSRMENDSHLISGMDTDTCEVNGRAECGLIALLHHLRPRTHRPGFGCQYSLFLFVYGGFRGDPASSSEGEHRAAGRQ